MSEEPESEYTELRELIKKPPHQKSEKPFPSEEQLEKAVEKAESSE